MAALFVAIFLCQWLVLSPRQFARATSNTLLLSSLKEERERLAGMVAAGCTSSVLRTDGAALEAYRSTPDGAVAPLPTADGRSLEPEQLAALLDASVALIISQRSHGSGFFVAPDLVVTNSHVVENGASGLWVTSKALGKVVKAELVSKTRSSEVGQPDFALLRLPPSSAPGTPLTLAEDVTRLSPVVAAGYPGIVVSTDPRLARLLKGDPSQAPETVLSPGEVSVTQPQNNGVKLIIHTADISPGNSGGPLVDRCGRVVGVNTFVSKNSDYASRVLYALSAADLAKYLRTNGVTFTAAVERCETVAK